MRDAAAFRPSGDWVCGRCGYVEARRLLSLADGGARADPSPALPCPNDGEPMRPVKFDGGPLTPDDLGAAATACVALAGRADVAPESRVRWLGLARKFQHHEGAAARAREDCS